LIRLTLALLVTVVLSACNASTSKPTSLQLWSDHKSLAVSAEVCSERARAAVGALGFTEIVKNDNFTYANHGSSRAAVKCISMQGGSFVYFAVAGPDKASVEKLRNQISWKL
jgi:hypothetical protein